MYELKQNGKVFTRKFVGTGPSSYEKRILPGRRLKKVEKYWCRPLSEKCPYLLPSNAAFTFKVSVQCLAEFLCIAADLQCTCRR